MDHHPEPSLDSTVWYFNHAIGRTQDLNYIPVDKIGNHSCNATQGECEGGRSRCRLPEWRDGEADPMEG
jgi:hypothetical protein